MNNIQYVLFALVLGFGVQATNAVGGGMGKVGGSTTITCNDGTVIETSAGLPPQAYNAKCEGRGGYLSFGNDQEL
jgi:hypothetical protein